VSLRRPTGNLVQYANLLENLWRDDYMAGYQAMSRWVRESVPVPGAFAREMVDRFVRDNELMTGEVALGGRIIELSSLSVPCLVAIAEHDDMVPLACAAPLTGLLDGGSVEELRVPGGHIALAVGRRAMKDTIPRIIDWVRANSDPIAVPSGTARRAHKE
jgi:polyhydroxyalkanoate synthase